MQPKFGSPVNSETTFENKAILIENYHQAKVNLCNCILVEFINLLISNCFMSLKVLSEKFQLYQHLLMLP
jgi:hypothetical protein